MAKEVKGLSVVIPVGQHRARNLELVLTSLCCQTLPIDRFEVIVVNDGAGIDVWETAAEFSDRLDLRYVWSPKFTPGWDLQPRNKGARLARFGYLVFADSDVILHSEALSLYVQDMTDDPDRIVAGLYHWLRPMQITPHDIQHHFDSIIAEQLPHLPIEVPQSHNICRDMRLKLFQETEPHVRHYGRHIALSLFSGNICWPVRMFWGIGGYWNELSAGLVEDGISGLLAFFAGYRFSFDKRIIGGHLYHPRNLTYVIEQSKLEIDKFEKRFKIGLYANGSDPDRLDDLCEMDRVFKEMLGVTGWSKEW